MNACSAGNTQSLDDFAHSNTEKTKKDSEELEEELKNNIRLNEEYKKEL